MDLLAMATFEKAQRVGTFVIVFATLMLIDAGPTEREQLFIEYTHIPTMAWLLFLAVLGVSTTTRGYSMLDVVRRQRECRTKRLVAAMASDRRPSATLFAHR